jgi:hypothetical protein
MKIFDFLKNDDGDFSMVRLMSFGCFIMAVIICIIGLKYNKLSEYHISIIEWLGFAFGGKIGQKVIEKKK